MASLRGRQKNFDRYQLRTFLIEERSSPNRQKRREEAERQRLHHRIRLPHFIDSLTAQRRDYLFEILLLPEIQTVPSFGIMWSPNCSWAEGPSIAPYANIFDRFVGTAWTVSVVDDIDGSGTPGWVFERS